MSVQVRHFPNGALMITSPAGTFFVDKISERGHGDWHLQGYAPGDVDTAGTFMGHYDTRDEALARLELRFCEHGGWVGDCWAPECIRLLG